MKTKLETSFIIEENRQFVHKVSQCTSDILYILDLEKMEFEFINKKAGEILDHDSVFFEMMNPADRLSRMKHLESFENLNEDETKEIDVQLKVKDGSWRWFRMRDIPFRRNANGIVYQIIGFVKDIHEQKLARTLLEIEREKLKEEYKKNEDNKKLLQSVFDTISSGILVYKSIRNQENKIVDFRLDMINNTIELEDRHMVQIGRTLLSILPSANYRDFFGRLVNTVENNTPGEERLHYDVDGNDNWYDIKYQKFEDGVIIAHLDITDTKKTEELLKESRDFIDHITNTTPDIIYLMDLEKKSIVFSNDKANQILGQSPAYICSQGLNVFHQFLHPQDFNRRMEHLEACKGLRENEIKEIDVRLKVRNGTWHWFRIRDKAFKRKADGTVVQAIGIAQDIHEQNLITLSLKHTEMQIMQ